MGQYDKAIEDYSKVITLTPDTLKDYKARAYGYRGSAYRELKKYAEAKADFQKACELKKDFCGISEELAEVEKWQPLGKSGINSFFYDKTSIRKQPNGHIRVWQKMTVDDVSAYIEERKKKYQKTEGYENYSHDLVASEIDCDSANMGLISGINYDNKGKILASYNIDEQSIKMEPIVPDTMGDALYKIVCKEER